MLEQLYHKYNPLSKTVAEGSIFTKIFKIITSENVRHLTLKNSLYRIYDIETIAS